jgi:hypothetical protein
MAATRIIKNLTAEYVPFYFPIAYVAFLGLHPSRGE